MTSYLPTVSVVVPTRDRPEMLLRALSAINAQDYEGTIEVLVVFDRSEPCLPEGITWGSNRIICAIVNDRTPGLAGARNTGILTAAGELVAFCDDDDEWLPGKVTKQVEVLSSHSRTAVCGTGIDVRFREKSRIRILEDRFVTLQHLIRSRVMEVHPSTVLARRSEVIEGIGLVDEGIPGSYAEDYEWLLRCVKRAPVYMVPEALVRVYWHDGSWFSDRWATIAEALRYLLTKHPEFSSDRRGLARIYGQVAFAEAAAGNRVQGRHWATRALRESRGEKRAYVAYAVSIGLLKADSVRRLANSLGRGI